MSDGSDPRRDEIHALLQQQGPPNLDKPAVLTGWVLVSEWMDDEGEKWLTKGFSASLTAWTAGGFHHEALYGDWPDLGDDA